MTKMIDKGRDAYESLTHDQAKRAGITCERIARSLKRGVAPKALAEQLTENERKNNKRSPETVTEQDVLSAAKMYRLNQPRQVYPQTAAADLEDIASHADDFNPVFQN